ncbi:MAG: hypothetical protein K8H88_01530 [Sandaracinaceae bacterium]|nr:hypothetical protein [Sandaracinaceae bacterium]
MATTEGKTEKKGRTRLADLSEANIRKIRARYAKGGVSMAELGTENGLSAHQISQLVCGLARADAGGPLRERKARLTAAQVSAMRKRYAKGELQVTIAKDYGVSISVMSRLLRGLAHAKAGGPTFPEGRKQPRSRKLSAKQIERVLKTDESDSALARDFGVSRQLIQQFRKRWKGRA